MKKRKKQRVAIFDVDGTIFRSSLFIELTEALIANGVFKKSVRNLYTKEHTLWLDRKGSYEDYIMAMVRAYEKNLKGVRKEVFDRIAEELVEDHKNRVYRYTRDLIAKLRKKGYFLLAISQSPKNILDPFCKSFKFDKVYGRIYESDNGRMTGKILYLDLIRNKAGILMRALAKENLTLKDSIAVGDTEGDISVLSIVDKPICFNPNQLLLEHARRKGWKVVVERKDVIYKL